MVLFSSIYKYLYHKQEKIYMSEIKKLNELEEIQVNQALDVFVEGFYNVFSSVSKDKSKLHRLFKNSFDYDMTFAYLHDGEVLGFLGIGTYEKRSLKLNKEILFEIMGKVGGKIS